MAKTGRYAVEIATFADPAGTDVVESTLTASQALLGVVARSAAEVLELVTLPQLRIMVVLAESGPSGLGPLAQSVGASPATIGPMMDRMLVDGWVERSDDGGRRRQELFVLSAHGSHLVAHVANRRREEVSGILGKLSRHDRKLVSDALAMFSAAAGEPVAADAQGLGL